MRDLKVVEVKILGMAGYQVQGWYRDCPDSFWETVAHDAVFRDPVRAQRFLEKCRSRPSWRWDWQHWGRPATHLPSDADAIQKPVAVYTVL